MGFIFSNKDCKNDLEKLFVKRRLKTSDEFIEECVSLGYDREMIELVVQAIYDYLPRIDHIALDLDDDVHHDLQIDDEDFGDIMVDILRKLDLRMPNRRKRDHFFSSVQQMTIREVLNFIEWVEKK